MTLDLELSKITAGVMKWGAWGAKLTKPEMAKMIEQCLEVGVTSFDHADIYGGYTTEREWGDAFKETKVDRDLIQVITKCGIMMPCDNRPDYKVKHYDYSRSHIIESVNRSLLNLQCGYIDLLLLHRPSALMNPQEIAFAVAQLKDSGKIRHFGVSNFNESQMSLIGQHETVEVNQLELSATSLDYFHDGTLDYILKKKIVPMAWSPLSGGDIFGNLSKPADLTRRQRLKAVADKHGYELDELLYLFLLHHPAGIIPVTGTSKIDRIKKAHECLGKSITNQTWFEIWTAAKGSEVP